MAESHDVVLGAGLAGLTAAYTLQQAGGHDWLVFDKEQEPGGHARSIETDGYVFDFGPHILFTNDAEMEALIRDLLGDNMRAQERQAFIYHAAHDLYTRFPFQAHLYGLPVELVQECLVELVRAVEARARNGFSPSNYEEWMRSMFGDAIADRLMIPYARKIWTVEPSVMDFNWIGRRVPTPDVERIVTGALTDDVAQIGATSHFWYPWEGGIAPLGRALAARVTGIQLGREMTRIDLRRRVIAFADGEEVAFDRLVFTLPLCFLPRWFDDLPSEVEDACLGLEYQGIFNVNLGVDRPVLSDKHWVYFYEDEFPFHRLSFPANFSPRNVPEGKSSISTEVAYSRHRPLDRDRLVDRTIESLRAARILDPDDEIELVQAEEILPAYVIYDLEHGRNVATIRSWLEEQRIWTAGRFGEWQYFNMDHSMKSGKTAAEAILAGVRD
ncbi:MAG: FAD-dependent oxidoreductase [Gaiellaceae bacterium]